MKKVWVGAAVGLLLSFASGAAFAARVHDWKDLHKVHMHLNQVIHEMERARAANHYDMDGHGAKAEALARQAEGELRQAEASSRAAK